MQSRSCVVIQSPQVLSSQTEEDSASLLLRSGIAGITVCSFLVLNSADKMRKDSDSYYHFVEIEHLEDCMTKDEKNIRGFLHDEINKKKIFLRYCDNLEMQMEDDENMWAGKVNTILQSSEPMFFRIC